VYGTAAVSKLVVPEWRNGTALYNLAYDPYFGIPTAVRGVVEPAFGSIVPVSIATWSVVAMELGIAVLILGGRRARLWALAFGIVLHSAIIVLLGLFSFGLVMISLLAAAYADVPAARRSTTDSTMVADVDHQSRAGLAAATGGDTHGGGT
jgi:antimicrobial peptide system SdpB family protein